MKTIFTEQHKLRNSRTELYGGTLVEPFERPSRAQFIIDRVREVDLGPVEDFTDFGLDPISAVHDRGYVEFLQRAWLDWSTRGFPGEALTTVWPARRMSERIPTDIEGRLGYYSMSSETSISKGTWEAAYASAQVAITGADKLITGENSVFALCRPPGHHAALDMFGGYCFLNNAAIAAQFLLKQKAKRVAVLDVDFHHGNGTQDIFYTRSDVLYVSLHGDPNDFFPHFLGFEEEKGQGAGEGFNANYSLPSGTNFKAWRDALSDAINRIATYNPDFLVVSLGVDTFSADPISSFQLQSEDFTTYGADLAELGLPTLFVMEGGYAISEIGVNTVNVLSGFKSKS